MTDKATRKSWIYSAAAHALVAAVSLLSFFAKPYQSIPMDSVTVELVSADQLPSATKGIKTGDKAEKKPIVEKVADTAKPIEDAVGKIDKKTVVTDAAPKEQPKPQPVEKKPEPPKDVEKKAEAPKAEKKSEPKPEPKIDPIAEAIKQESKKPQPKQEAKSAPAPQAKPRERNFDSTQIAALLDKRDPSRQAATGETLNSKAALGKSTGAASFNAATWGSISSSRSSVAGTSPMVGRRDCRHSALLFASTAMARFRRSRNSSDRVPIPRSVLTRSPAYAPRSSASLTSCRQTCMRAIRAGTTSSSILAKTPEPDLKDRHDDYAS